MFYKIKNITVLKKSEFVKKFTSLFVETIIIQTIPVLIQPPLNYSIISFEIVS
jgi:hypothetical protein